MSFRFNSKAWTVKAEALSELPATPNGIAGVVAAATFD
jgi:hypothetical protein